MDKKLKMLEEIIGYTFKNEHLLPHALTHSSYANERHWDKKDATNAWNFWEMRSLRWSAANSCF